MEINNSILQELLIEADKNLPLEKVNSKRRFLIAPVGLVGSGRREAADIVAKRLDAFLVKSDEVRAQYLRPRKLDYGLYTEPMLAGLISRVFDRGYDVVLDRDNINFQEKRELVKVVEKYDANLVFVRIVSEPDVMIRRLMDTRFDPLNDILADPMVAIREMWRRTPLHYDWIEKPVPAFNLKNLKMNFLDVIDMSDYTKTEESIDSFISKLL